MIFVRHDWFSSFALSHRLTARVRSLPATGADRQPAVNSSAQEDIVDGGCALLNPQAAELRTRIESKCVGGAGKGSSSYKPKKEAGQKTSCAG